MDLGEATSDTACVGAVEVAVFANAPGTLTVDTIDAGGLVELTPALAVEIARVTRGVKVFDVAHGQRGLLHVDGALTRTLDPGRHAFLETGRALAVKLVDMRRTAMEVTGQELMTRDRVSIRVNLSATYRVADAVMAVSTVKDFADTLYRAVGAAFRAELSTRTLDDVLAAKGRVDADATARVVPAMAGTGVEVEAIILKDIILPGEMRDILNTVVAAKKRAEAAAIARREEAAETRTRLNTAKVMADNPVMMRLKELEALEAIADRVGSLTVHNGTRGILEDLVSPKT